MRLAQNIPVEDEEFELAGLNELEDIRVGDRHAVVLSINRDIESPIRFSADRIPEPGEMDVEVARDGLWMILLGFEALRSCDPGGHTKGPGSGKGVRRRAR